ncbi:hypothetical protein MKQ70_32325 [Chitinophaga sedimenti]|uniref:hypothetical protein n=1 Tax=Chitinophaga sedimenti TaxID=2033606 RepID=UPI002006A654|nr:hypothetical protein [Chitinophaga sedimenti]MCK7559404.1 hypothetical protein [Chitinophaga sedimenti]
MINFAILDNIIQKYKANFSAISNAEIYKWAAVKCFQDNFNPKAPDFKDMLLNSLSGTRWLMDTQQYFPKRMITEYMNRDVAAVRTLFHSLFNEQEPLVDRLAEFCEGMRALHSLCIPDRKQSFQDTRACMVYLSLRYPEKYFLYKYEMFRGLPRGLASRRTLVNVMCTPMWKCILVYVKL